MKKILLVYLLATLVIFSGAVRAEETHYLISLPDIPLMPQMRELDDSRVVFDKAEGRIVEETVQASNLAPAQVTKFYNEALPPLGWKRLSSQRFLRNGEQLIVNLEKLGSEGLVKFSVSPNHP